MGKAKRNNRTQDARKRYVKQTNTEVTRILLIPPKGRRKFMWKDTSGNRYEDKEVELRMPVKDYK